MNIRSIFILLFLCTVFHAGGKELPLIDMQAMRDARTLDVDVVQDWHVVKGEVATRQKVITIHVGDFLPDRAYRVPVRMVVPLDRKARGFHLTGGHQMDSIMRDARLRGVDTTLVRGGVGLVHTVVQGLQQSGQAELGAAAERRFVETLNPHYSIQYWGWPATLMRAVTAAYAETGHFEPGKVALSGGSKNGASPSAAILHDTRMTAVHAGVSPIWESPLRMCDRAAWDALEAYNKAYAKQSGQADDPRMLHHPFLGGTFGPIYNRQALAAGHSWEDLRRLALRMKDHVFISRHLEALRARKVDLCFQPGTHDFVAFDLAWGGAHYADIPLYLKANSGHGQRNPHHASAKGEANLPGFLVQHFFEGVEPMLASPLVETSGNGSRLLVTVTFKPGDRAENGRIWWMFDRGPDGSAAYIRDLFPDDQWKDMDYDEAGKAWTAEISVGSANASRVDFFTTHRKTLKYQSRDYRTYRSSPYTRVDLKRTGK